MKHKFIVHVDDVGTIGLQAFDKFLDITKVKYYEIEELGEGKLRLTFYDEEKELIQLFVS